MNNYASWNGARRGAEGGVEGESGVEERGERRKEGSGGERGAEGGVRSEEDGRGGKRKSGDS